MNCTICKNGETQPGTTTVTLERGETTLVFKSVPAQICENCGETYLDEETTRQLWVIAERAVEGGVQVEVRAFSAV
jgi:YgiT-type zinc finger domain-containing protein